MKSKIFDFNGFSKLDMQYYNYFRLRERKVFKGTREGGGEVRRGGGGGGWLVIYGYA